MSRNIIRDKLSPYPLSSPLSLHIDPCIQSFRSVNMCDNADIPTALNVNIMKRFFLLLLLVMMQTAHAQSVTYDEEPLRSEGTRLNSSHVAISYAVFCLKKKT